MSASQITIAFNALGLGDIKDAAATIYALKQGLQGLQGLSQTFQGVLPGMTSPVQGLGQGRNDYEQHNRLVTDQAKQIRDLTQSYKEYQDQVFNVGRAYGYARDQMVAMADASKQLQGTGFRAANASNAAAYARLTGMDPVATAQSMAGFAQQGVATNQAQQQQFIAAIEGAVQRGSSGGYTVLTSQLLPILSSINQQALARNPFGTGLAGTEQSAGILANMYASGIPGLRGQGAADLYGQVNQALTSSQGGQGEMLAFRAYQQAHPGADYFEFQAGRQAGMQDPAFLQAMLQQTHQLYGGGSVARENYLGAQALGLATPQNYAALRTSLTDAQGNLISTNPADYAAVLKRIGAKSNIDTGALGLIGRAESTTDQAGIEQVIGSYEQLTGSKYTGKRDKESVERMLGQRTTPMTGSEADTRDVLKSDVAKNYEDAAEALNKFSEKIYAANDALSFIVSHYTQANPNQVGGVAMGGGIVGGVLSAVGGAITTAITVAIASGQLAKIAGPAGDLLANILGKGMTLGPLTPGVPTAPRAPTTPGVPRPPGGAPGEFPTGAAIGAGLIAAGAYVGYQALVEQPKRDQAAEAARSEQEKEARYQKYLKDKKDGPLAAFLHPEYLFMDDAQSKDIQAREARDKAGGKAPGTTGATSTTGNATQTPADAYLAQEKQQTDLLTKIEAHLAAAANFDKQAQAAYGAGSSTAPRTMNAGGPVAAYVPGSTTAGGGASYVPGAGAGTGKPGQGFGEPTVDQVNAMLKGTKLEGYGAEIIKDAKDAGVPVSVALAMIKQESSFNTPAQGTKNNFGGLKGKGGSGAFADFPDISSGLSAVIGNMGTSTYQGKSLADFVNTYLGGPAGGDPDAYLKNVLATIQSLGGNAGPNSVPVVPGGGGGAGSAGSAAGNAASNFFGGAAGKAMLGGGGGGTQQIEMVGRAEIIVKYPDGTTDRQWVTMAPSSGTPFGGIINWPTRGVSS